ncbi:MAG: hypothetical protein QXD79_08215 [Candidatus Methanomethylicia archaeon]
MKLKFFVNGTEEDVKTLAEEIKAALGKKGFLVKKLIRIENDSNSITVDLKFVDPSNPIFTMQLPKLIEIFDQIARAKGLQFYGYDLVT